MVGKNRMRDHGYVPLGHVAVRTIIRRIFPLPDCQRHNATFLRMAGKTFLPEIGGGFLSSRLHMRIVAANAAEFALAVPVTLAKPHGKVMLQQVILRRGVRPKRNQEDCESVVERSARAKV